MNENQSHPVEFLAGEKVYLRPIEQEDVASLHRWANDSEIRGLTGEVRPSTYAGALGFYQRVQKSEDRVWLAVVVRETHRVIGETGLLRMFPAWRTTDWSLIIGDAAARGQGYGTEVARLMLDYAFGYQNFHRVSIGVVGFNSRALNFYSRIGFQREGLQRQGYYYEHQYHDFVMMSMLENEFRKQWQGISHSKT